MEIAHIELRELVKAGLTPYQALVAGTRSAGVHRDPYEYNSIRHHHSRQPG